MSLQLSASLDLTGSLNLNGTIFLSGSIYSNQTLTVTSSNSVNATSASYINASDIYGTVLSSSYAISSSYSLSSSYSPTNITASWSNNSVTASYVTNAQSASYYGGSVTSASYSLSSSYAPTNITASWSNNSLTASYINSNNISGTVASASYSLSSSYAPTNTNITSSWSNNSLTASYYGGSVISSSYSLSSSYAPTNTNITSSWSNNSLTASYAVTAQTASYYGGSVTSASYALSSSYAPTNTNITASWSNNSLTASYVVNAQSASYYGGSVTSASYSLSSSYAPTNITASWSNNSLTSSYVVTAQTASYYNGSVISSSYSLSSSYAPTNTNITSSWSNNSISSSYSLTSSYALNAGSGGTTLTTGSTYPITSSWSNNSLTSSYVNNLNQNVNIIGGLSASSYVYSGLDVIAQQSLKSLYSVGDEGGEIFLNKSVTNTTITGGVTIDIFQNKLRFFEQGGTNRGAYIDITACTAGVGTNLLLGGSSGTTFNGGTNVDNRIVTATGTTPELNGEANLTFNGSTLTVVGNISASSYTGSYFGTSSWSNNTLTASYLTPTNNYTVNNITSNATGSFGIVGIGTTSPSRKLHIDGGATTTVGIYIDANGISGTDIEQSSDAFRFQIRDNIPALFYTNNTERIRISSDGNVGIGTSTTGNKLTVVTSTQYDGYYLRNSNGVVGTMLGVSATNDDGTVGLYSGTVLKTNITANGASYFNGGNVGIGTSSPGAKLQVVGTANVIELVQATTGSATYYVMDNTVETGGRRYRFGYSGASADKGSFTIYNQTDNITPFTITTSGSVGIGTINPVNKLEVVGNISASAFTGSHFGTSSWANNAISSSYALSASYAPGGGGGGGGSWTTSNYTSNLTTQSVAIFNASGNPDLSTPPSDNVYLVYQNGIMKWIPIVSAVFSLISVNVNEAETIPSDGNYQNSITPVTFGQLAGQINENESIPSDGLYETAFTYVTFNSSFTSGSI